MPNPQVTIDLTVLRDQALRSKADAETILSLCDGANLLQNAFTKLEAELKTVKADNAVLLARVDELLQPPAVK